MDFVRINNIYFLIVFDFLIANCNRDFGNRNGLRQGYVYVLGICFGLVNGFSRFLWGWLMDKFGFKVLMFFITVIEMTIAASLFFSVHSPIIYVLSVLLISACIGCHFSILSPCFNKIFGLEVGPEMYGLTGNFIGIASICGPIMTKFIIKDTHDFLYAFIVGGTFCLIKIFVLLIFDENDKYDYKEKSILTDSNVKQINDETL